VGGFQYRSTRKEVGSIGFGLFCCWTSPGANAPASTATRSVITYGEELGLTTQAGW